MPYSRETVGPDGPRAKGHRAGSKCFFSRWETVYSVHRQLDNDIHFCGASWHYRNVYIGREAPQGAIGANYNALIGAPRRVPRDIGSPVKFVNGLCLRLAPGAV